MGGESNWVGQQVVFGLEEAKQEHQVRVAMDSEGKEDESPKRKTTGPYHNAKYKAKMCKNWVKQGFCPYHEKCQFAHGAEELEHWIAYRKQQEEEKERRRIAKIMNARSRSMSSACSVSSAGSTPSQHSTTAESYVSLGSHRSMHEGPQKQKHSDASSISRPGYVEEKVYVTRETNGQVVQHVHHYYHYYGVPPSNPTTPSPAPLLPQHQNQQSSFSPYPSSSNVRRGNDFESSFSSTSNGAWNNNINNDMRMTMVNNDNNENEWEMPIMNYLKNQEATRKNISPWY